MTMMSPEAVTIISAFLLAVFLMIGIPVPFAFSGVTIVLIVMLGYSPDFLIPASYSKLNNLVLLCIPLFMIAGAIIREGKIGDALIGFMEQFIGRFKTGLGTVTVFVCGLFGAISGSSAATQSAVGSIMAPKLKDRGYPRGVIAALLASSSVLGLLIPPSAAQILYGWSSGTSVLACFLATIVPGIIVATLFCIVQHFQVRNLKSINEVVRTPLDMSPGAVAKRTGKALPALFMPVIILGGIYSGMFTTMEAAAIAVFYCIPVAIWVYRGLKFNRLGATLAEAGAGTGAVMMMLMSCQIFARILTTERVPDMLLEKVTGITDSSIIIILLINLVMIILGMLMDDGSAILLSTPLLLPIAQAIGIDPVHYAAIMGVNLGMGLVTPPAAPMLFLGAQVAKSPVAEAIKPTLQYVVFAWLPTLLLVTFIPEISLTLPGIILGYGH